MRLSQLVAPLSILLGIVLMIAGSVFWSKEGLKSTGCKPADPQPCTNNPKLTKGPIMVFIGMLFFFFSGIWYKFDTRENKVGSLPDYPVVFKSPY